MNNIILLAYCFFALQSIRHIYMIYMSKLAQLQSNETGVGYVSAVSSVVVKIE